MLRPLIAVICAFGIAPASVFGDDKPKQHESFEAPIPQTLTYPATPQAGTREVWQYYGVDRRGRWVPRVIMSPSGAYYYYNGAPFRYTTSRPTLVMPYIVD